MAKKTNTTSGKKASTKKNPAKKAVARKKTATAVKTAKKKTVKRALKKTVKKKAVSRKTSKEKTVKQTAVKKTVRKRKPKEDAGILTQKELDFFRDLLLEKRREIVGDVSSIEGEALKKSRQDAGGDLSSMPIHMADMGTDNFEQEFAIGLVDSERKLLNEINDALTRIVEGVYGVCQGTNKPIVKARLEAVPWARYCIEYATMVEKGLVVEGEKVYDEDEQEDEDPEEGIDQDEDELEDQDEYDEEDEDEKEESAQEESSFARLEEFEDMDADEDEDY